MLLYFVLTSSSGSPGKHEPVHKSGKAPEIVSIGSRLRKSARLSASDRCEEDSLYFDSFEDRKQNFAWTEWTLSGAFKISDNLNLMRALHRETDQFWRLYLVQGSLVLSKFRVAKNGLVMRGSRIQKHYLHWREKLEMFIVKIWKFYNLATCSS